MALLAQASSVICLIIGDYWKSLNASQEELMSVTDHAGFHATEQTTVKNIGEGRL